MAFRKNIKKKTIKTTSTKRKKNVVPASHKIDGIVYASKELADFHRTLKCNPVVKDFHLMNVTEEKKYNSGRYKSKECYINGIKFDSLMEAKYYVYLLEQKNNGFIKDFSMQVKFPLMNKYRNKFTGKVIRGIDYYADFVVNKLDDSVEAIDVKGVETDVFKIKQKLFGSIYPDIRLACYRWSDKYGNRWVELDELKKLIAADKKKKKVKDND